MERVKPRKAAAYVAAAIASHEDMTATVEELTEDLLRAADMIAVALHDGGQLLLCGNGGSAADAQHLAAEFSGRFMKDRKPWPALALHTNTSALTAIGNDYGFDAVYERQVRAFGRLGDVLIAISTSGDSPNVLRAVQAARDAHMTVIGLAGPTGGVMAGGCDVCLQVRGDSTPRIQEGHILIGHILCGLVEDALT